MSTLVQPQVSIVIPTHNATETLPSTIEACLDQSHSDFEIIVVDDGSTDDTEHIVRCYPVRYLKQENAGPASARNRGWRTASGEIICFTDSDCVPARDWVSKLVEGYTSEEIGGVGGTYDMANDHSLLAACVHEEIAQRHLRMPRFVDYLGSFNLSYRRSVLEEVRGFDESYRTASGEDNDLAYRVKKRGYKLAFTRDARVAHYHPEHLSQYLRQQFRHGYWRAKLYRSHPDMAGGDVYGRSLDYVQPPLALAILCLLPLSFIAPIAALTLLLLFVDLLLQLPITLAIIKRTGDIRYLSLALFTFLRGFARGLGMVQGTVKFFVLESVSGQDL